MATIAWTALALLLPTAAMYVLIVVVRGGRGLAELRRKAPPPEPADHLQARLRRLRAQLEATEAAPGATAKHHRVAAVRGAYLDTLREACARLEVSPPPGGDRARQADIYRAEAALRERGLDVREPAGR
ncbi:MAG TPA: hypothetical protein VK599_00940 [Streptosporangiaceae bacterium]|jgi:hypothetical protein|nr:hypothetical protein [Streptosporangiaceae bacterium]